MDKNLIFGFLAICIMLTACAMTGGGAPKIKYDDIAYSKPTETNLTGANTVSVTGPGAIVYKTRANYNLLVPVGLFHNKTAVSSYPGPTDVTFGDGRTLRTPTPLHQGYLLDNRGIGLDTAFVNITYAEYAVLQQTPSAATLFGMIVDADPFTEMYECGHITVWMPQDEGIAKLNAMIDDGKLAELCKRWK
jgi:hypothetical protein